MPSEPLTRHELADIYEADEWRVKFLDLLSIGEILANCVIDSKFKVSDELNRAIVLTDAGKRVRDSLITKAEVEAKDANVLCLLGLAHVEPLVDVEEIDIERLIAAISDLVKSKRIRFPFIFGRGLYDAAVRLFPDERRYLHHDDTLKLLGDSPQGVFHCGKFLLGPFGIIATDHQRDVDPRLSVPIQHCADLSCHSIHRVRLSSSQEPGVNRNREALYKALDQVSKDPSDWSGFVRDITEDQFNPFEVDDPSTLPYLLGDAFSDTELRSLAAAAVKATEGRIVARAKQFGATGPLELWIDSLNRAQLMQLLLTETDESLAQLLDRAVEQETISVPEGEVRAPVVNRWARSGAWQLRPELSSLGFRTRSNDRSLRHLRLSALARSLFDSNSADDIDDLAWILRDVRGKTTTEQLESFLRSAEPSSVLRTLVFSHRGKARRAAEMLRIERIQPDNAFLDVLLWKLGFSPQRRPDVRDAYWAQHDALESMAKTADATLDLDEETLRGRASNYFVELERFLFDSLVFAGWVMLNDHFAAERPFDFVIESARRDVIERINQSAGTDIDRLEDNLANEPALSQVVQGFSRLANLLDSLRGEPDAHKRRESDFPRFVTQTDLELFPFVHTIPFLDLTPASQVRIVTGLRQVSSELNDSGIMTARNGLLHAKLEKRTPTTKEVDASLTKARAALYVLEEIGCVRTTFELQRIESDQWGRARTVMKSGSTELTFFGPSGFELVGLPSLARPVYLVQGAVFAEPNEMLRFRRAYGSDFATYWSLFPIRPEPGNRGKHAQGQDAQEGAKL